MKTVLVVDDMAIFREPIAASIRSAGYQVHTAADGKEGLAILRRQPVSLVLLDLAMPVMDGIAFLTALRADPDNSHLPVILLTAMSDKDHVLRAAKLGISDYLLKSRFSLTELLARISKHLATPPTAPATAPAQTAPAAPQNPAPSAATPQLKPVSRAQILRAADEMAHIRSLGGTVSQVLAFANSPRGSIHDLASVLQQDPVLSARVFQMANSAALAGARAKSIDDAVRKIGAAGVRTLAMSAEIIESLSKGSADGVQSLRCWQHGLAVASIMSELLEDAPNIRPGVPHLVGLCHDFAEIFLRHAFPDHYHAATADAQAAHTTLFRTLPHYFALAYEEVTAELIQRAQLPEDVARPIIQHASAAKPTAPLVRALKIADAAAHALLLASSPTVALAPLTPDDWRDLPNNNSPLDTTRMRREVIAISCALGRLSPAQESELLKPLLPPTAARILYLRDPSQTTPCDPIEEALKLLSALTPFTPQIPTYPVPEFDALIIAASDTLAPALLQHLHKTLPSTSQLPALLITPRPPAKIPPNTHTLTSPFPLTDLHRFLAHLPIPTLEPALTP